MMSKPNLKMFFVVIPYMLLLCTITSCGEDRCNDNKISASDTQPGDSFGYSVSISGDLAIVGAPAKRKTVDTLINAGAAYIFTNKTGKWIETAKLISSDIQAGDDFGKSVSISGDMAIIGAPGEDGELGDPDIFGDGPGAAYIFQLINGEWIEKKKITSSTARVFNRFGESVSISGKVIIVGEPGGGGSASIFQVENNEWIEKIELVETGVSANFFGRTVSVNGKVAIVGADEEAFVYELVDNEWVEKSRITATDSQDWDDFGISVSTNGEVAIVGAPGEDGNIGDPEDYYDGPGAAYIFQPENDEMWVEKQKLVGSESGKSNRLGNAVSISGGKAIVGQFRVNAALVFTLENGKWIEQEMLTPTEAYGHKAFGVSVAVSEEHAIIGASVEDMTAGAAYIFQISSAE